MDLYWSGDDSAVKNLSGASLVAVVKDGKGNICGENKVNLPDISDGNLKEEIVDVLLKARCSQISYDVSLLADNQDLAKVSYKELTEKSGGGISDYGVYAKYGLLAVLFLVSCSLSEKEKNIWIKNSPSSDYCWSWEFSDYLNSPTERSCLCRFKKPISCLKNYLFQKIFPMMAISYLRPDGVRRPRHLVRRLLHHHPRRRQDIHPLRRHLIPIRHHFLLHRLCQHLKSNLTYL